jgi:hypothetical protein
MKTTTAKHYWSLCKDIYLETDTRSAFEFPEWLQEFKNDRSNAEDAFIGLQAAMLMILDKGEEVLKAYSQLTNDREVNLQEYLATWAVMDRLIEGAKPFSVLSSALTGLSEYLKFTGGAVKQITSSEKYSSESLHSLVAEASKRDASFVTPIDVADFMKSWIEPGSRVHVYGLDGLGLLYAARRNGSARLVGDEFGRSTDYEIPKKILDIYSESQTWFRTNEFINREFIDMECRFGVSHAPADSLLINAARFDLPFFDPKANEGNKLKPEAGFLNHCLNAGYSKIVVLVSNHFLTAGKGVARNILDHCIKNGLTHVIQLPMGVLGFRSQQHSILIFEKQTSKREIKFIDYSDIQNIKASEKGFGLPRRAFSLKVVSQEALQRTTVVPVSELDNYGKTFGNRKKLLSFEAGQFSEVDALAGLRQKCTFMRIHQFMDVFRSHHIEENTEPDRSEFTEIGASSISEFGWITGGRTRTCPTSSLERRQAQVLRDRDIVLCFRGSPDSFGKVGLYRSQKSEIAIPNQSFVILRLKNECPEEALSPELLVWWLNSTYAKNYLKLKSISPDVMRISPRDIDEMEVPIGPDSFLKAETSRVDTVNDTLEQISRLSAQLVSLQAKAWVESQ